MLVLILLIVLFGYYGVGGWWFCVVDCLWVDWWFGFVLLWVFVCLGLVFTVEIGWLCGVMIVFWFELLL